MPGPFDAAPPGAPLAAYPTSVGSSIGFCTRYGLAQVDFGPPVGLSSFQTSSFKTQRHVSAANAPPQGGETVKHVTVLTNTGTEG
jgi:hypothetical protein